MTDLDVLVVGAQQAGLALTARLARIPGLRVLAVDALPVGQTWLDRWDSLQLFTPRHFSALPGRRFPSGPTRSPSRTEMAAYLQAYAEGLPVRTGVRVERLSRDDDGFTAVTSTGTLRAQQVVLATGAYRRPRVPDAAAGLDPAVAQLHSAAYRRPSDLPPGDVLVVGGGNSAAQLALELARDRRVTVAAPRPLWLLPEDVLGVSLYWWLRLSGLLHARSGGRTEAFVRRRGDAVVGRELGRRARRGEVVVHTSRVVSGSGREVTLADGTTLPVSTVLWCTGFLPDTGWVDVPGALAADGTPVHTQGASPVTGLHWLGLPWQTRMSSAIVAGAGRDARQTADRVLAARGLRPAAGPAGSAPRRP